MANLAKWKEGIASLQISSNVKLELSHEEIDPALLEEWDRCPY